MNPEVRIVLLAMFRVTSITEIYTNMAGDMKTAREMTTARAIFCSTLVLYFFLLVLRNKGMENIVVEAIDEAKNQGSHVLALGSSMISVDP